MTEECAILIIGGGSAGCVLARRLADRTSGRIILLEAGKTDEGDPSANDLKLLDGQTEDYDWGFTANTLRGGDAQIKYARAKLLGGCANHNDCAFIRPPDSDFAEWESLGAIGWGPADMAPMWDRILERVTITPCPANPFSAAFIAAGRELGLPMRDFSREVAPGVGVFPLNAAGRVRHSSSVTYLHPLATLPRNLEVWTGVAAERLLFEGKRAVGADTTRAKILAKTIILTAGAIQTPQLLMLSGVGPAAHLQEHAIAIVADHPHVGGHLQDHVAAPVVWSTKRPVGDWDVCPFEATMMLALEKDATAPDILFHFGLRVREKYVDGERFPHTGDAVKASPNVTRARSKGMVRLTGPSIRHKPHIALNYFSDPHDLPLLMRAMAFTRKLGRTDAFADFLAEELYPGPAVQTEQEWESYILSVCETVYHACGTAGIGRVVNEKLQVKGVEGLYVADASVFPSLITVNINSAVMMVAERAADLFGVTH